MMNVIGLLAILPAIMGLLLPDGPLAWYVTESALVVTLLLILSKGLPLRQRLPILVGVIIHICACIFGAISEDSKVPSTVLWFILVSFAVTLEITLRLNYDTQPTQPK